MKYISLLILLAIVTSATAQDIRTLLLSKTNDLRYQCSDRDCLPSTITSVASMRMCEIACLAGNNCRTVTYDQFTKQCEQFADIPSQYGSLVAQAGVVTMTAIDDRQLSARK